MKPHAIPLVLLWSLLLLPMPHTLAAIERAVVEAKSVKAAYIYNFTKFINWASEDAQPAGQTEQLPITICVIGEDPVASALDEVQSLHSQGRPIKVIHVPPTEDIPPCHILYIAVSEESRLTEILSQASSHCTLTVSDLARFVERGGMIGFVAERGRIGIKINAQRARLAGLQISSKLLEVARNLQKQ